MRVALGDDGEDGELSLDGEVEGALLEREEVGLVQTGASSLREDPDSRVVFLHVGDSLGGGLDSLLVVLAINEDGIAQLHKDTEKWKVKELLLGHDNAMLGEDTSKDHHVHRRLVVADNNSRVVLKLLLAYDLVGDTTRSGSKNAKESRNDIVDDITLVDERTGDGNEATCDRHDQSGEEYDYAFCKELGFFGEDGQDLWEDEKVEERDADRRLEICYYGHV